MKRNATQREQVIGNDSDPVVKAQLLIGLKRKVLDIHEKLIDLGSPGDYMAFCITQAAREGKKLDTSERKAIQQIMNLRVFTSDVDRVEFIERALQAAA